MLGVSDNTIVRFCGCEWNDKLHPFIAEDDLMLIQNIKRNSFKKKYSLPNGPFFRNGMVTDCPVLTAPCSFAHPEGAQCPQFKTSLIFSIQFSGNKTLQNSSGWWLIYCYIIYRYIYIYIYMVNIYGYYMVNDGYMVVQCAHIEK